MRVYDCGNTLIVSNSDRLGSDGCPIVKVDADHYLDASGSLCLFEHAETKSGCIQSVRRAFGRLKALVNCNYERVSQVALLTLTYADNMRDYKKASRDVNHFIKGKLRPFLPDFEYIYVKETQARGAWHFHIILFFAQDAPRLSRRYFGDCDRCGLWSHGMTDYTLFDGDINNLGQYLSSMLTQHGSQDKKASRLLNYPAGMRLYCCSRGVKRPVVYDVTENDLEKILSDRSAIWRSTREYSVMLDSDKQVGITRSLFTCLPN